MSDIAEEFADVAGKLARLGGVIRFDFAEDGRLTVDARGDQPSLLDDDADADCTIRITRDNLRKLVDGKLDPMLAYAMGKIKISGSMPLAMKMASALG